MTSLSRLIKKMSLNNNTMNYSIKLTRKIYRQKIQLRCRKCLQLSKVFQYKIFRIAKQSENEQLKYQIQQYEMKMSFYGQYEDRNQLMHQEYDQLEKKYSDLLKELRDRTEEAERWKTRTSKLEVALKDMELLVEEMDKLKQLFDEQYQENKQYKQDFQSADEQIKRLKQNEASYLEYIEQLQNQIKMLEEQLLSRERDKSQQYSQLTQQSQQQIGSLNSSYKNEISQLQEERQKLQLSQTNLLQQIKEKDEKIKKLDSQILEKEGTNKQLKRDFEQLQKKLSKQESDHKNELNKFQETVDEKYRQDIEELNHEKQLYKDRLEDLEAQLRKTEDQMDQARSDQNNLNNQKQSLENEMQDLNQQNQQLQNKLLENEQINQQQTQLMSQLHQQEISRLKSQLQMLNDNYNREQQNMNKILNEKENQLRERENIIRNLQGLREKEKHQYQLLMGEVELLQAQLDEMQNQKRLEIKIKEQMFMEQSEGLMGKYEIQIHQLMDKIERMQHHIELKNQENDELSVVKNEISLKLNDAQKMNQHIKVENDSLKQTLLSLQHQKQIEDDAKDEVKRRDVNQVKQYYETIQEQMDYEIKGLKALLDQKSKECEEWRSCYLRMRK